MKVAGIPTLHCEANCIFHGQWCFFYQIWFVWCAHWDIVLKPSSHYAGLENVRSVGSNFEMWALEGDMQTNFTTLYI